jgi:hypothetical protein
MGISKLSYDSIQNSFEKIKNKEEKILIELGIQESYFLSDFKFLRDKLSYDFLEYKSLDLHDIEGVTLFDLSEYKPESFSCDVITNIGTSEHIEFEKGQYNCWKNMHNWLEIGGIAIHELPEINSWKNHCRYYCSFDFFQNLEKYGYKIKELTHHNHQDQGNLIWCVLEKLSNLEFMPYDEFFKFMKIDRSVTSDLIYKENNPKNLKI